MNEMKFQLGMVVATPGALNAMAKAHNTAAVFLGRHSAGDWGDLDDVDKRLNDAALADGSRILSAYHLDDGVKIWVITEADRSATTILLPDEY